MATDRDAARILSEEILNEARGEAEEIVKRARQEAEKILAAAEAEGHRVREEQLGQARAEALRRTELIQATVPLETGRMRVQRIESLLESVHERAREALLARRGFTYRDALVALAAAAINQMTGNAFSVKVPTADQALLGDGPRNVIAQPVAEQGLVGRRHGLRDDIARAAGQPGLQIALSADASAGAGGVIVEDADVRQVCDNGLLARLERMWPALRRQIAQRASFVPKTGSGGCST
jgi:vacuolar-type H+-ATPase subunit E/Vma4